jgi:hypothetical protein
MEWSEAWLKEHTERVRAEAQRDMAEVTVEVLKEQLAEALTRAADAEQQVGGK